MNEKTLSNGVTVPQMLFGSFQMKDQTEMNDVVHSAVENGVFGFDTSPSYHTEGMLAEAVRREIESGPHMRESFFVQSKIDSWQMILQKGAVRKYVLACLEKTGLKYWDALLIHWPQPDYLVATWRELEQLYRENVVRSIGVCNFSLRHFRKLQEGGAEIVPQICQNEIHPLNTESELTAYCRDNDIVLQAYSPLCRMLPEIKEHPLLNELAEKNGVSVAQLILRWHIEHGRIPIVKTSSAKRAKENTDVFSFSLSPGDVQAIDSLDRRFKIFLESRCCPGY